jgi:hypothetical protein
MTKMLESKHPGLPNHSFFAREVSIVQLRWYIDVHARKFSGI